MEDKYLIRYITIKRYYFETWKTQRDTMGERGGGDAG
jgi:hypothetical protein